MSYAGSDIARGETLLRRGTTISSREIGMLAACGFDKVDVVRRPKVAVLSTGDELAALGAPLRPGAVYDSNGAIIAAAVARSRRRAGRVRRVSGRRGGARDSGARRAEAMRHCCSLGRYLEGRRRSLAPHRLAARGARRDRARCGAQARQAAVSWRGRRKAHRRAAGFPDLGDLHLPRFRCAGDPRQGRPAAGSGGESGRDGAGAHPVRDGAQGIRAGGAGRARGRQGRISDRQGLRLGHDVFAGRRLPRSRCAAHVRRSGDAL